MQAKISAYIILHNKFVGYHSLLQTPPQTFFWYFRTQRLQRPRFLEGIPNRSRFRHTLYFTTNYLLTKMCEQCCLVLIFVDILVCIFIKIVILYFLINTHVLANGSCPPKLRSICILYKFHICTLSAKDMEYAIAFVKKTLYLFKKRPRFQKRPHHPHPRPPLRSTL